MEHSKVANHNPHRALLLIVYNLYAQGLLRAREREEICFVIFIFYLFFLIVAFFIPSSRMEEDVHVNADDINIAPKPSINESSIVNDRGHSTKYTLTRS